ncbi:MAG TPA: YigZ family protein [Candidatus Mediterraneibacter guildfordensis]|nr:YigZ family protein [Candidatus Mediterraneibacter guildfordensis]
MEAYTTVCGYGTGEIVEKKSRFIAEVFPVVSEDEISAHIEKIKKEYWDARHHCWAYVIGQNPGTERMSDDGEPAGTAGKPILEVIRGRGLTDVLVVVTRYFGGTLLGTGGLVRAYTQAALEGLSHAGILRKVPGVRLKIGTDYTGLGKIQYLLAQREISILDTVYTDRVEILTAAAADMAESLKKEITEGTSGQAVIEEDGQCWLEITEKPPA